MVCDRLGIELEEIPGWTCTGAGVIQEKNQLFGDTLNARNFAKAEQMGLPILTICSTCQGTFTQANHRLQSDPEYRDRINREYLASEGLRYDGTVDVKHFLWILDEDFGLDNLKELVVHPLEGLKIASFYGCYLRRPPELMVPKGFEGRKTVLEKTIETLGGEVVNTSGKGKCCGFPILSASEENSLAMCGDHTLEAKDKGADCIVTPCPLCHLELDGKQGDAARHKERDIDLPILHLPQLVGLALGFSPRAMGLHKHLVSTEQVVRILDGVRT
jgi:succinate dehydrogenase / fumarate reductase cytochrome b subunit